MGSPNSKRRLLVSIALLVCALLFGGGLFLYEQAYVRAGQLPPLS